MIAYKRETNVYEIEQCHKFVQGGRWGWPRFISSSVLSNEYNGLLPDDTLTIFCEVTVIGDTVNEPWRNQILQFRRPKNRHSEDLSRLFDNSSADCTLNVGGIPIKAHNNILAAVSPVFEAMFRQEGTTESVSNVVNITDIEYNIMNELVRYIYTGESPNLQTMAVELLVAADKYSMMDLKVECEQV